MTTRMVSFFVNVVSFSEISSSSCQRDSHVRMATPTSCRWRTPATSCECSQRFRAHRSSSPSDCDPWIGRRESRTACTLSSTAFLQTEHVTGSRGCRPQCVLVVQNRAARSRRKTSCGVSRSRWLPSQRQRRRTSCSCRCALCRGVPLCETEDALFSGRRRA